MTFKYWRVQVACGWEAIEGDFDTYSEAARAFGIAMFSATHDEDMHGKLIHIPSGEVIDEF